MATQSGQLKELTVPYFDGLNLGVGDNISKKTELVYSENVRSQTVGFIEKRLGYRRLGGTLSTPTNYGLKYFANTTATNTGFFRVSTVGATTSIYYLKTDGVWTALAGSGTSLTASKHFFTEAEGCLFVVNGTDANRYIGADGVTVTTSSTAAGHLYSSPIANKIAFYKDRLYVGDYKISSTRYPTGIMFSSKPLGIVSLVDGDHITGVTTVNVTDTKYIQASDTLNVYRGGTSIATLTVSAKTETSITVTATGVPLLSSDELWVNNTYSGSRLFRWAVNAQSGEDVKQFDTFKLSGSGSSALTLLDTINDVLVIANKENMGVWNEYNLKCFDMGISCVSERGYAKGLGLMFFVDYSGLYSFDGVSAPKLLSSKVEPFFTGATKTALEGAAVGVKGKSVFVSLSSVTLYNDDGSVKRTLSNIVLELNLRQNNWYLHTGITTAEFRTYKATDNPDRFEFAGSTGEVYEFLRDSSDDSVTTDKEIPFNITLGPITLCTEWEDYGYPKEIIVETKSGSGIKCFISVDDENEFFPLEGDITKGVTVIKVTKKSGESSEVRCRILNISLREMSVRPVKISKIKIKFSESAERNTDYPK